MTSNIKRNMKKTLSIFTALCICMSVSSIAFASENKVSRYDYVATHEINLGESEKGSTVDESSPVTVKIHTYKDNGKKVYKVDCGETKEEKLKAFEALNKFMESGRAEQTVVPVTSLFTEFYGNEYGYASNTNAMGYSWAKYVAGDVDDGGYDNTWGGQSALWAGSGNASYIILRQAVTLNVVNANATLSISWPPSLDVSQTRTASTATWNSETEYSTTILGAEHQFTEFNWEDLQYGYVTSCVYSDSADIKYGSTIYRPTQSVRFTESM